MEKELALYLKSKKGLNRLFLLLRDKYVSLGRFSGVVILADVSEIESRDLSSFLGRNIICGSDVKISYRELNRMFAQTRYASFSWEELFKFYFGEKVLTNQEKRKLSQRNLDSFFEKVILDNRASSYVSYLEKAILDKDEFYRFLKNRYSRDGRGLGEDIGKILMLLDHLPNDATNLSVYSALTGNPHYLDLSSGTGNLFLRFLSYVKECDYPDSNGARIDLLSEINVYVDPISNYVITYKLIGNEMLDSFSKMDQVLNLNLSNIISFGEVDTKEKVVYIFENPSILNALGDLNVPMVITSGIPNLALYKLLEKLEETGNRLYYNGDFDPEGLLIADKLVKRFSKLELFGYSLNDYEICKSSEEIGAGRLKKLAKVTTDELMEMREILISEKKAGYQEKNIERIRKFIVDNRKECGLE